jgi:hypothetical protein
MPSPKFAPINNDKQHTSLWICLHMKTNGLNDTKYEFYVCLYFKYDTNYISLVEGWVFRIQFQIYGSDLSVWQSLWYFAAPSDRLSCRIFTKSCLACQITSINAARRWRLTVTVPNYWSIFECTQTSRLSNICGVVKVYLVHMLLSKYSMVHMWLYWLFVSPNYYCIYC